MREIKFRGKRIDNGEWVFGWVSFQHNRAFIHSDDMPYDNAVEVDPATVGQFTGLKDKSGREIYEGDVVKYGDTIHEVVFEQRNNTAYFGLVYSPEETRSFGHYQDLQQIEIIGNVHDNPELLEGGDRV
jgi:uncharacterized phage protein (TIGR01671 family)